MLVLVSDEDRKLYVSIRFVLVKDQAVLMLGQIITSAILLEVRISDVSVVQTKNECYYLVKEV